MELRLSLLLLCILSNCFFCQLFGQKRLDKSVLTIEYQTLTLERSDWPHPSNEFNHLLCVGEKCSMFQVILPKFVPGKIHQAKMREPDFCHDEDILQGYPEGQMTCKVKVSSKRLYYVESLPTFEWNMLDCDTIICGYECQKACTTFRGRTWTVWFTVDLPYPYGPWKLGGLPGLIMKAIDDKLQYSYEAIEIKKGEGKAIKISTTGYKKSSPENVYKEIIRQAKNPTQYEIDLGHVPEYYDSNFARHDYIIEPWTPYPIEYFDIESE